MMTTGLAPGAGGAGPGPAPGLGVLIGSPAGGGGGGTVAYARGRTAGRAANAMRDALARVSVRDAVVVSMLVDWLDAKMVWFRTKARSRQKRASQTPLELNVVIRTEQSRKRHAFHVVNFS